MATCWRSEISDQRWHQFDFEGHSCVECGQQPSGLLRIVEHQRTPSTIEPSDSAITNDREYPPFRVNRVVSINILIGGAAPYSLKQDVETAIKGAITGSDITVHIASPEEKFGGDSLQNIVNRLTAGGANGIQIEQSPQARSSHWQDIADAVANVYSPKLGSACNFHVVY
jgi:hypothetical protein